MRFVYLLVLLLAFPTLDLAVAWLYGAGSLPEAGILRNLRDASIAGVAIVCLVTVRLPQLLRRPVFGYFSFVAVYSLVGLGKGVPAAIVIPSAGTLLLPVLLVLVGYYCMRTERQLLAAWVVLCTLGVASALFGAWDINHTEFWTDVVRLPEYMLNVKGVDFGLELDSGLPFNFFGGAEMERRSAGLLAAPLAQGSFLATLAVIALVAFSRGWRLLGMALAGLMLFGAWQTGTRGALIVALIGVLGAVLGEGHLLRRRAARWLLAVGVACGALYVTYDTIVMSVNFLDGSTIGHWEALLRNIQEFHKIVLIGDGVGRQGGVAAQHDMAVTGGGEGAFFSIAFQTSLPGALVFLWFYVNCMRLMAGAMRAGFAHRLARALIALMAGFATTLVSSEHILTLSGMAALWLLVGGAIRTGERLRPREPSPLRANEAGFNVAGESQSAISSGPAPARG